jgi:hypothetical protein
MLNRKEKLDRTNLFDAQRQNQILRSLATKNGANLAEGAQSDFGSLPIPKGLRPKAQGCGIPLGFRVRTLFQNLIAPEGNNTIHTAGRAQAEAVC